MPNVALACQPVRKGVPDRFGARWLGVRLRGNPGVQRRNLFGLYANLDLNAGLLTAGPARSHVVP